MYIHTVKTGERNWIKLRLGDDLKNTYRFAAYKSLNAGLAGDLKWDAK